jgi:hypothetical protein
MKAIIEELETNSKIKYIKYLPNNDFMKGY